MRRASPVLLSARHPLLRRLRRALSRGELTPDGCCAVEGIHLVEEALRTHLEVPALVAGRSAEPALLRLQAAGDGRLHCYLTSDRVFHSLAQTESSQGIAALVRLPTPRLEECLAQPRALVVALWGVRDPGNLGTILRTLEAFGGTACLLGPETVSPFNAKAVRASAGSLFRVAVFPGLELKTMLGLARKHGLQTVALTPRAPRLLGDLKLDSPVAFFVGQEASGLPEEVLSEMDDVARIPLAQPVESLNAAVAASLALYEAARQRALAG
ncbi:MAG: TrmH family RNA methyltransferase [Terriglobia bacterium]